MVPVISTKDEYYGGTDYAGCNATVGQLEQGAKH